MSLGKGADINMPGITGLELLPRIPAMRTVPIMMITTDGDESTRLSAHEKGAKVFFRKPSDFAVLNHELEQRIAVREIGL
jgi:DNA-binding response OmpR family regulator